MNDELPSHVEVAVERLRRSKRGLGSTIERLLDRWKAGDAAERLRVEKLLVELAKPNTFGRVLGLVFALLAFSLGVHFYLELELEKKVESAERAVAKVTRLSEGFCVFGSKRSSCLDLEVEVRPRTRASFRTTITHDVSDLWSSRVQPGSFLVVALDPIESGVAYLDEKALEEPPPEPFE